MIRQIPPNILHDLHTLNDYTAQSGKESKLTVCSNGRNMFTANAGGGDGDSVESLSCNERFGKTKRIMDLHTHPADEYAVGCLPSQADMAVTLSESYEHKSRQTSCISNKQAPYIVCQEPRKVPTSARVRQYINHEVDGANFYESKFHQKNIRKDFNTAYFDPATGMKIQKPDGDKVMQTMFGQAIPALKTEEMHKGKSKQICKYVNTVSGAKITNKCKQAMKKDNASTNM